MRRTNEEFKAELEKRCQTYRREQARKRKNLLTAALCVGICCVAAAVFDPFGASSEAPMAEDAAGELKSESAIMQSAGSDGLMLESDQNYSAQDSAYAEFAGPMEPEANMSITDEAAEVTQEEAEEPAAVTVTGPGGQITLDAADSAAIMDYLNSDQWIMSAANCLCDYTLEVNGETYRYHSDCGTVQNESGQSLTLPEEEKEIFNGILGQCPMRIE